MDSYIVQNCMPKLEHYIGVDPDMCRFDQLSSRIPGSQDLKVT